MILFWQKIGERTLGKAAERKNPLCDDQSTTSTKEPRIGSNFGHGSDLRLLRGVKMPKLRPEANFSRQILLSYLHGP